VCVCVFFLIYICDATLFLGAGDYHHLHFHRLGNLHFHHPGVNLAVGISCHECGLIRREVMCTYSFQIMLEILHPIICEKSVTQCP
jgi:hypothetical protein